MLQTNTGNCRSFSAFFISLATEMSKASPLSFSPLSFTIYESTTYLLYKSMALSVVDVMRIELSICCILSILMLSLCFGFNARATHASTAPTMQTSAEM